MFKIVIVIIMMSVGVIKGDSSKTEYSSREECEAEATRLVVENLDSIREAFPDYSEIGFYCTGPDDQQQYH